jgi:hypothetical protein
MDQRKQQPLVAAVLIIFFTFSAFGQTAKTNGVLERNVRAGMEFLAGDAMQGRGSGTAFERIAAEYVGSQFMQFGLEPAGDKGWDGKPSFVQNITVRRIAFTGGPTVKFGELTGTHGKDLLVLRTNTAAVSGKLQKLKIGDKPEPGAVVFVTNSASATNLNQVAQILVAAGASMVLLAETPVYRSGWTNFASRKPEFTETTAAPGVMVMLSTELAAAVAAMPDGTSVSLGGETSAELQYTWNAIGKITGTDAKLSSEAVVLSAHLDHLGVRENTPGDDKIFNGADDDASGTVAVIELARVMAAGPKPKRTVYFVAYGSEESGGHGSRYFVENLPFPKDKLIANLQFEMIGRPDAKVKADELWLTGYERSNLGPELAKRGAKLVQDPHPEQNFFRRSDNFTLARQGIVAHTVSSFGLHTDYHRVTDELKTIDFVHMTRAINSMISPINWLVNSDFSPAWNEGMRP